MQQYTSTCTSHVRLATIVSICIVRHTLCCIPGIPATCSATRSSTGKSSYYYCTTHRCPCATRTTICTFRDHHFYRSTTVAILTVFFSFFCTKRIIIRHFSMISDDHVSFSLSPSFTILVCFPCTLLFFLLYLAIPCSAILLILLFLLLFHLHCMLHLLNAAYVSYVIVSTFFFFFCFLFYIYFY